MGNFKDIARFYLASDNLNKPGRLVNVITLKDRKGELFEYKITFEGIKGNIHWSLRRDSIADSSYGTFCQLP